MISVFFQQRWVNGGKSGFHIVKFDPVTEQPIRDKEGKCIPIQPGLILKYLKTVQFTVKHDYNEAPRTGDFASLKA